MIGLFQAAKSCSIIITALIICVDMGSADKFSGLCPPSYPRLVVHNSTGQCFQVGNKGPCSSLSVIASDPLNPNYGICRCKDYGSNNCFGRPLIPHKDRCYFEFSQGPCKKSQWFIRNKYGNAECRKMPCPIIERQRDLLFSEFPETDFYFTIAGGKQCFKTGTQAFCNFGERVYFLGTNRFPSCLRYDPYNCNAILSPGSGIGDDYYYGDHFNPNQEPVAFGVPYDGI